MHIVPLEMMGEFYTTSLEMGRRYAWELHIMLWIFYKQALPDISAVFSHCMARAIKRYNY